MNTAVARLLASSLAPASWASYKNAWKRYVLFHAANFHNSRLLPVSEERLAQFIAFCHYQQLRPSTITSYISAISYVHKIQGLPSPTDSFLVKKLLHGTRRAQYTDKRKPFTLQNLHAMIHALPTILSSRYDCILFKAMLLTAFFALLRVGEYCFSSSGHQNLITWDQLTFSHTDQKVSSATLLMVHYKHSQGHPTSIPIARQTRSVLCPVRALLRYCKHSPFKSGPLFHDVLGNPITCTYFRSILRSCAQHIHLDPSLYTSHSLRIGGATHAHVHHMAPESIQRLGRWRSKAFLRYIRPTMLPVTS